MVDKNIKATADFTSILKEMSKVLKGWGAIVEAQLKANTSAQAHTKSVDKQTKSLSALAIEQRKLNKSYRDLINQQKALARQSARTTAQIKKQNQEQARQVKLTSDFIQKGVTRQTLKAKGGTTEEVLDYKNQIGRLKELQKQHGLSYKQIRKMWRDLATGEIKAYTGAQRKVQTQLVKIQASYRKVGTAAGIAQAKMRALYNAEAAAFVAANKRANITRKQLAGMNKGIQDITISWKSFIRLLAVQLFHQAVSLFVRAIRDGVQATIELEKRIAEVQTISQNQPLIFEEWRKGLIGVSDAWGLPILDTVEGAYQAISNQIAEGAEAITFMTEASQLAVTGVASTADSVNLLTAALNAFNLEVDDTEEVAASFFKTVELGRVRISEMANTFGRIAVPADKLGIQLNELNAAISSSTIQGLKYNEAATLIRNVLLKLIRPTDAMKELFAEWGVESGEAAIKTFGFAGVLAKVEEASQGSSTELGRLFGRIRAITGAMLFAGKGLQRYQENLAEINKSTETYNERTAIVMENTGKRLEIEFNKISNFFIDISDKMIRAIDKMTGGFTLLTSAVRVMSKTFVNILVPALAAATIAMITFIRTSVKARAALFSFGIPILFATGIQVAFEIWQRSIDAINDSTEKNLENWHKLQVKNTHKERDEKIKAIKDEFKTLYQELAKRASVTKSVLRLEKEAYERYTDFVKDVGTATSKTIKKRISEITKEIQRLENIISTASFARGIRQTIDQAKISRGLSGADTGIEPTLGAKFDFLKDALKVVQDKARLAALRGQSEEFQNMAQFAQALAQQLIDVNDQFDQSNKRIANGAKFLESALGKIFTSREILSRQAEEDKKQEEAKLERLKKIQRTSNDVIKTLAKQQLTLLDAEDPEELDQQLRNQENSLNQLFKIANKLGVEGQTAEAQAIALAGLRLATEQKRIRLIAIEETKAAKELEAFQIRKIEREKEFIDLIREAIKLQKELTSAMASNQFVRIAEAFQNPNQQAGGHGIDTQTVNVSPQETIMNPKASRRFYSTLTAMNAGIQRFADGGAPVQYSVGDIHLHPQSASDVNIQSIGKGLRREIRRGRLRLN